MIYLTDYTEDNPIAPTPSAPLPYDTIEEARAVVCPNHWPLQVRNRWQIFELGAGIRVCLSTFPFS